MKNFDLLDVLFLVDMAISRAHAVNQTITEGYFSKRNPHPEMLKTYYAHYGLLAGVAEDFMSEAQNLLTSLIAALEKEEETRP